MEKTDLPFGLRTPQVLFYPAQLRGIHVVAIEGKESYIALLENVIPFAAHVERLVEALVVGIVMIAERGIELDSGVQHGLVGLLKLAHKIPRVVAAIDVVTQHNDEIE